MNNNIIGVVGVAQDVTETAQHDKAVAAMANELRQLIGKCQNGFTYILLVQMKQFSHDILDRYGGYL